MPFPRIDPNNPLTIAAREANAYAGEHGLEDTLEWAGMPAGPGELAYLAEQRAIRALFAAFHGVDLDLPVPAIVHLSDQERALLPLVMSAYLDGFVIGWRGRAIHEGAPIDR